VNPVEDRFDYVFVSEEIGVTECSYDYQGAKAAGSDHAIVTAELHVRS
jgi:endonuclease/exonuclease/phosphatase family metal-dependent hydrolase